MDIFHPSNTKLFVFVNRLQSDFFGLQKITDMEISNYINCIPNEQNCQIHFKTIRELQGIKCKKCGNNQHYWLKIKKAWQCSNCRFRTTLRSGTIMQGSHLPFKKWYHAMVLMTTENQGISAKEMQRKLKHKRYDTVWSLMHRIRNAMGNRQDQFTLEGIVHFNSSYLLRAKPDGRKLKRGKRTYKREKMKNNHPQERSTIAKEYPLTCRSLKKMKVHYPDKTLLKDWKSVMHFEEKLIGVKDKSSKYLNIKHHVQVETIHPSLKYMKIINSEKSRSIIDDVKEWVCVIYYRIKVKYLRLYLDEFCYRINQMKGQKNLFDQLACTVAAPYWN